ncbi:MAG: hypothetical protein D6723_16355 [Acidobacteria bacterium]|nr:MAG: hypothetical protein D6723_16355 [Acidobacteriota bacterium]
MDGERIDRSSSGGFIDDSHDFERDQDGERAGRRPDPRVPACVKPPPGGAFPPDLARLVSMSALGRLGSDRPSGLIAR